MIGLVLIYFIGKAFYDLAGQYNRSQWGFAILGVVSYYAGAVLTGVAMGIMSELGLMNLDDFPDAALGLFGLPMGILFCWGTYTILKSQWRKASKKVAEETLDSDFFERP